MTFGEHQQQRRAELCERFVGGPEPSQLRALLSATRRERDEIGGELILARHRIQRLERELDQTRARLARAREVLTELAPDRYWQECHAL